MSLIITIYLGWLLWYSRSANMTKLRSWLPARGAVHWTAGIFTVKMISSIRLNHTGSNGAGISPFLLHFFTPAYSCIIISGDRQRDFGSLWTDDGGSSQWKLMIFRSRLLAGCCWDFRAQSRLTGVSYSAKTDYGIRDLPLWFRLSLWWSYWFIPLLLVIVGLVTGFQHTIYSHCELIYF